MQIKYLISFVKIVQLGSFHSAAKQLHSSQPAISARINSLENELGVQLFERDASGAHLTARGKQLLPYAEKMVRLEQEIKAQLQNSRPERGNLRIGVADTLAHLWLTELLSLWQQTFPLMEFEITVEVSSVLSQQLQQHHLDLALLVGESQEPELTSHALCEYPQCWVANADLATKINPYSKPAISLADLSSQAILSFGRNSQPWLYLRQQFATESVSDYRLHCCSSIANLLPLAQQGLGSALLPEPAVRQSLESGQLCLLPVHPSPQILRFYSCWRRNDERHLPQMLAQSASEIIGKH